MLEQPGSSVNLSHDASIAHPPARENVGNDKLRHGWAADAENEGLWFADRMPDDGVPIGSVCGAALASPQRLHAAG